ncbi:putative polynucleotide kinase 3'-phosphatase [Leptomonas seymouri]|uniref:Putative polynucleotide kinase 3'-phosphatase n=1 Tax=Leptomonas seymouri TaxID=5684 RepID=A0A0N0P8B7_LEPSE|nr:putative polynucleotide kinase 3'-phosphatase [Leptomonas seymouri]|eukprot:KPI89769.1 putative polynucleotide kinase 3'-phosphatase [Leptomonas seymouri]
MMPTTRKRQRSSSLTLSTAAQAAACRCNAEWEALKNSSVLLLPPTISIVKEALHKLNDHAASVVVKIAAFDMDDTLIKPASGGVFSKDDPTDWQWVHPEVRSRLQYLHRSGFLIVLCSNQMGIGKGSAWNAAKADAIEAKVVLLSRDAAVPLCACVATRNDAWRKPSPHMWQLLVARVEQCVRDICLSSDAEMKADVAVDCEAYSFYVGDAAGRSTPTLAGRKKDFSCSDRQFAYNLQLPFFTPEQIFTSEIGHLLQEDMRTTRFGETESSVGAKRPSYRVSTALLRESVPSPGAFSTSEFSWGDVSPEALQTLPRTYAQLLVKAITPTAVKTISLPSTPPFFALPGQQELIILVGFPGCGKSSFYHRHLQPYGYCRVNRDTLQTRVKCIRAAEEYWALGRSVVVDNTNPTAADRQAYIDIVKKHTQKKAATALLCPVRIFYFTHTRGLASHMDAVRAYVEGVPRVPPIAYNVFQSKLELSMTTEDVAALGIEAVWAIPPVACFDDAPAGTGKAFYLLL